MRRDLRENLTITQHTSCDSHAFHSACRLKMHCQHTNTITVTPSMVSLSAGDASKINDVHSINLMDQMSESLWIWMCKAPPPPPLWVNMVYILDCVSTGPARRQWVRPVPSEAPCVQSRTRSTETAGWRVGTMLLSHTHRKEKEGKKQ